MPSVASASSRATVRRRIRAARAGTPPPSSASPASTAVASPYAAQTLGFPRRSVVVVHRRQVVVDEREVVDELDRRRRRQHLLRVGAGRLADRERDHGPHALAAARRARSASTPLGRAAPARARAARGTPRPTRAARQARPHRPPASRALELRLDLLRELGELAEHLDRRVGSSVASSRALASSRAQLALEHSSQSCSLRAGRRPTPPLVGQLRRAYAHAASLAIRPRMPLTSRAASSDA